MTKNIWDTQSLSTSGIGFGLDKVVLESTNPIFSAMNPLKVDCTKYTKIISIIITIIISTIYPHYIEHA